MSVEDLAKLLALAAGAPEEGEVGDGIEKVARNIESILPTDHDAAILALFRALYNRINCNPPDVAIEAAYILRGYDLMLQSFGFDPEKVDLVQEQRVEIAEKISNVLVGHRIDSVIMALWDALYVVCRHCVERYEQYKQSTLN